MLTASWANLLGRELAEFQGTAALENLQQTLSTFYNATGKGMPVPMTGTVDDTTIAAALSTAFAIVGTPLPNIPQPAQAALGVVQSIAGLVPDFAKSMVGNPYAVAAARGLSSASAAVVAAIESFLNANAQTIATGVLGYLAVSGAPVVPPPTGPGLYQPFVIKQVSVGVKLKTYPAGTIATARKEGGYRVAVPIATMSEFGEAPTHTEVEPAPSAAGLSPAQIVAKEEFDRRTGQTPWYKKWQTYAIAGGVAVVGGGAWWALRRRRA